MITYGEMSRVQGLITAWDAVQRLRPRFLRNAGRTSLSGNGDNRALVRIDDVDTGLPEVLRTIEIQTVKEILAPRGFTPDRGRERGTIHVEEYW